MTDFTGSTAPGSDYPRHPTLGQPDAVHRYQQQDGRLFFMCRFEPNTGNQLTRKEFRPYIFDTDANGHWSGLPDEPYPLYGIDRLRKSSNTMLVVEGEKVVDAVQAILPQFDVTTSVCGAKSAGKSDWRVAADRVVYIVPDNDEPGMEYARDVEQYTLKAGATKVVIISLAPFQHHQSKSSGSDACLLKGWDLADAIQNGWSADEVAACLAEAVSEETSESEQNYTPFGFFLNGQGVWRLVDGEDGKQSKIWICSHLRATALARSSKGEDWSIMLNLTNQDETVHRYRLPMKMMAGEGSEYRGQLLDRGLRIAAGAATRKALHEYLTLCSPRKRAKCVPRPGWHGRQYIRAGTVYGEQAGEEPVLTEPGPDALQFHERGTLAEWQNNVGCFCQNNSRLVFAVNIALASFMLAMTGQRGGGFHFRSGSSRGKTTVLYVAASTVSNPGPGHYVQTWRTTDNALEPMLTAVNDGPLFLDEIGELDGRIAGEIAYMIAQGQGKSRSKAEGGLRTNLKWLVLFISTGEIPLSQKIEEAGKEVRAGQNVRIVDFPAEVSEKFGLFEDLHGYSEPRKFADMLVENSQKFYGTVFPYWIKVLIRDYDTIATTIGTYCEEFVKSVCPPHADPQVLRVAKLFSLPAAAGEFAIKAGILPWRQGHARECTEKCFRAWLENRGSHRPAEIDACTAKVRNNLQLYGMSRFETIGMDNASEPDERLKINERLGWKENINGLYHYYVTPTTLRQVICKGHDISRAIDHWMNAGWLVCNAEGKPSLVKRLPGIGVVKRLYCFKAAIITDSEGVIDHE